MKKFLIAALILVASLLPTHAHAQNLFTSQGFCEAGGQFIVLQGTTIGYGTGGYGGGVTALTQVQASFPQCLVTVYLTGTTNPAPIFSDNLATPTPLANPFPGSTSGQWLFYAAPAPACYDIVTGPNPGVPSTAIMPTTTYTDVCPGGGSGGGGGGTTINLETNGVSNVVQTILNLKSGNQITVTSDSAGGVTFSSNSLPDPGVNGIVVRTAPNITTNALAPDVIALWSGCTLPSTKVLVADGTCQPLPGAGVTTTGSPASGQVAVMSGALTITSTSQFTADGSGNVTATSFNTASPTTAVITATENSPIVTCLAGSDLLWADATDHRWKMCNNNGGAVDVAGVGSFASNPGANGIYVCTGTLCSTSTAGQLFGDVSTTGTSLLTTIQPNVVTSAKQAVVNTRRTCQIDVGTDSGTALINSDLGPQLNRCQIPYAATVVEIDVTADGGTPNVIVQRNHLGTPTALLSGALSTAAAGAAACSNTGGTTGFDGTTVCSSTLQNTAVAVGDWIGLTSGTAGGTAKRMSIAVHFLVN
jgi:hypothetical protein